jgi:hypothetical protein
VQRGDKLSRACADGGRRERGHPRRTRATKQSQRSNLLTESLRLVREQGRAVPLRQWRRRSTQRRRYRRTTGALALLRDGGGVALPCNNPGPEFTDQHAGYNESKLHALVPYWRAEVQGAGLSLKTTPPSPSFRPSSAGAISHRGGYSESSISVMSVDNRRSELRQTQNDGGRQPSRQV